MKIRLLGLLLALVACVCGAHGPYDSSAQLMILDGSLEANATLGMEGAKQVLLNAGLSQTEAADALASRGPSSFFDLPTDITPFFFELTAGGAVLKPQRFRVITDGLEASFVASYAGVHSCEVAFRARYFDKIEAMKPGAFIALDENRNIKAQMAFSRDKAETKVNLGAPAVSVSEPGKPKTPSSVAATPVAPSPQALEGSSVSSAPKSWLLVGACVILAGVVVILVRSVRRSS